MDWRNNKLWRKKLRRLDEKTAEFDLLVQRTIKGIALILKKYLGGSINLETFAIFEKIFSFGKNFDDKLKDPVWESVSLKLKKYLPFLNINVFQYKKFLRELINE